MHKSLIAVSMLLAFTFTLQIAVNSDDYRCMVTYSSSADDHLKINMKFPKINGFVKGDQYSIVLLNTETEEEDEFFIQQGTFRKQVQLIEGVVYKLCIKIQLSRSNPSPIYHYVEYKTSIRHDTSVQLAKIQIPKSLLRVHDLKDSYAALISLSHTFQGLKGIKEQNRKQEEILFNEQNQKIKRIQFISFIELAAIAVLAGYQFYRLKNLIDNRLK